MTREEIDLHGRALFTTTVNPAKPKEQLEPWLFLGFDTEYDSQTAELLSVQLTFRGHRRFIRTGRLNRALLRKYTVELIRSAGVAHSTKACIKGVGLVCFWSPAELQHIDVYGEGVKMIEYGMGNYDAGMPLTQETRYKCRSCGSHKKPLDAKGGMSKCAKCGREAPWRERIRKRWTQELRVIDLQQWFRKESLARVAKSFGLEKLEWDRENVSVGDLDDPRFREYALHDAELTEKIWLELRRRMWELVGVDAIKSRTPAATSSLAYRTRYLPEPIVLRCAAGEDQQPIRRQALASNWGGNNQSFVRGRLRARVYQYDAKSMYPNSVIQLGRLPTGNDWYAARHLDDFLHPDNIGGICRIAFDFPPETHAPSLPVYAGQKLLYPLSGVSDCTLAEVRYAVRQGASLQLIQGWFYRDGTDTFARYMAELMRLKNESEEKGDTVARTLYKLLANAVIGKTMQHTRRRELDGLLDAAHMLRIPVEDAYHLLDLDDWTETTTRTGTLYLPEWSTLILGYARATLAEAFGDTWPLAGTTDSVLVTRPMRRTEINGIHFALESTYDAAVLLRTRLYAGFRGGEVVKLAHHGVHSRAAAVKLFTAYLERGEAAFPHSTRHAVLYREALERRLPFGTFEERSIKTSLAWDNKRAIVPTAGTLQPSRPWASWREALPDVPM